MVNLIDTLKNFREYLNSNIGSLGRWNSHLERECKVCLTAIQTSKRTFSENRDELETLERLLMESLKNRGFILLIPDIVNDIIERKVVEFRRKKD